MFLVGATAVIANPRTLCLRVVSRVQICASIGINYRRSSEIRRNVTLLSVSLTVHLYVYCLVSVQPRIKYASDFRNCCVIF